MLFRSPLLTIKLNLLKAGIFPGCKEDCYFCSSLPIDCPLLKIGIQCLMDNQQILFEKTPVTPTLINDVSIITISTNISKVPKRPVKITSATNIVPLKITMPGPFPYVSDKSIPWNYGGEIYYHGVKQIEITEESSDEETNEIGNITGTSKITRSGRIFSPEIAPPKAIFGPSAAAKVSPAPIKLSVRTPLVDDQVESVEGWDFPRM